MWNFPLAPEQASTFAPKIDAYFAFLVGLCGFISIAIAVLIIYFAAKYHHTADVDRSNAPTFHLGLEITWTAIPLVIMLGLFVWSGALFFHTRRAPSNALEIFVIGKQWMWKIQHPGGQREINALHVPIGQPIKLTMTSQDVIHDFAVPAFRIKQDVVPGMYTSEWFEATKPGEYQIFCNQYCGTDHARMIGQVIAMEPMAYQQWLAGGAANEPMEVVGERLFQKNGCATCHRMDSAERAPILAGLYNKTVKLQGGGTAVANDAYIRESILDANAKIAAGYTAGVMPAFKGQISEEEILQLIAYIKSLREK